jgi:hypothetical protein
MTQESMRTACLLVLSTSLAFADRSGPPPPKWKAAEEVPCDGKKSDSLNGRYMCQLAIEGAWGEIYPCEIEKSYLHASVATACSIDGSIKKRFSGSAWCNPEEPDQIGHEALVTGKLVAIAGGFRMQTTAEMVKTFATGPDDARKETTTSRMSKITVNVCRRPWPKGVKSAAELAREHPSKS